ncbi:hypothetical protein [Halalkalibaculum sp. DA384]|uniref:hypothetical protein n=1 Tax=Halalkalibaculum sp. DA384 TaxID=3373606 RepID=UPI0037553302
MGLLTTKINLYVLSIILLCCGVLSTLYAQQAGGELPSRFVGDRIVLQPVTKGGDTLKFYMASGGLSMLSPATVNRLELPNEKINISNSKTRVSSLPEFKKGSWIPSLPAHVSSSEARLLQERYSRLNGRLPVASSDMPKNYTGEGILGQDWLATRIWTFDYQNQKVVFQDSNRSTGPKTPVYFKHDSEGRHKMHFPRIQVEIVGETFDMLLGTGAALALKETVHEALDDGMPRVRGTSYITRSQFEEWHFSHPEWIIYEDIEEDRSSNMIRVPEVTIADHTVGPVWFTTRPDNILLEKLSKYTDKKVAGALGGSLLKYFRFTINYPGEYVLFDRSE